MKHYDKDQHRGVNWETVMALTILIALWGGLIAAFGGTR